MNLPDWCANHSLIEFFQLLKEEQKKERNMTNVETTTDLAANPSSTHTYTVPADGEVTGYVTEQPDVDAFLKILDDYENEKGEVEKFEQPDSNDAVVLN